MLGIGHRPKSVHACLVVVAGAASSTVVSNNDLWMVSSKEISLALLNTLFTLATAPPG